MTPDKPQLRSLGKTPSRNNPVETATPNRPINAILEAPSSSEEESPGSINSIMGSDVEPSSSPELFLEGGGNKINRDQPGRLEEMEKLIGRLEQFEKKIREMEKLIGRYEQFEKKIRDSLVYHDAALKTELQSVTEELLNLKTELHRVFEELLNTRTELESVTDEQFKVSMYLKEQQTTKTEELQSVVSEELKKILDERFFMNKKQPVLISVMIITLPLMLSFVQSIDAADHFNHLYDLAILGKMMLSSSVSHAASLTEDFVHSIADCIGSLK
jgi:hypothetical protein